MDEKSTWECDILSRDNMSHPLVRHIAAKANHPVWQDVMQEPQNVAGRNAVATICRTPQFNAININAVLKRKQFLTKEALLDNIEPLY